MPQIHSTQGFGARNGVKVLVYGRAGRGKTRLCSTAPAPIILSAESGLLSLAKYNLPYIEIKTMQDLRESYLWAKSSQEAKQFQTICLDSISEVGEVVLVDAKKKNKDGRMAYGDMIVAMTECIKEFRDLQGFNVYMSAKQERIKDEISGITMNGPAMPGAKLGQAMPYFPDEVFQIDIEGQGPNSYHYLRCKPDFNNEAKDRSDCLDAIEEPHLGKIFNKIALATGA